MLEKIRNIANVGAVVPGFLRPIDTKRIAREADVDRRSAENGARNAPPPEARSLDAVEQEVVQQMEGVWVWQGDALLNQLRAYSQRLLDCSVESEFEKLQVKGKDTLARLSAANIGAEGQLGPLREDFLAYRNDLASFRKRHRLQRAVQDPARRMTTIGLLIFLVALESVLNGAFFADTAAHGLIGGIGIAIGISLLNVVAAFALGAGPTRWLHHRNWGLKLLGFLLLLVGIAGLFALHGLSLHLREASAALAMTDPLFTTQQATQRAIETLTTTPLKVADIYSFCLFALGLVFAFAALLKGYRGDDPYPGYGAHHRRARDAREAYSATHGDLFDALTDAKDATVKAIESGLDRIPRLPQEADSIRGSRATLLEQFRAYETAIETSVNQVLQRYRDGNRKARSQAAPAYFDERWQLPYRFAEDAKVRALLTDSDAPRRDGVTGALSSLRALLDEVLAEYGRLLRAYPHPTQMG